MALHAARLWPVLAIAVLALGACGDDDGPDPTATPDDGATVVQQGTVATLGPYRIGVYSVDADDASALVSITLANGDKISDSTLVVGEAHRLPDGVLELLSTIEGTEGERDTIRIRFLQD
jgi:hypothetical protein